MARPAPARRREPPQAGPPALDQEPGPVRLRLPALDRPQRSASSPASASSSAPRTSSSRPAPGVGKTHLATPSGSRPRAGHPPSSSPSRALMGRLSAPPRDRSTGPEQLDIPASSSDELGYLPPRGGGQPLLPAPFRRTSGQPHRHQQQSFGTGGRSHDRSCHGRLGRCPSRHDRQHKGDSSRPGRIRGRPARASPSRRPSSKGGGGA